MRMGFLSFRSGPDVGTAVASRFDFAVCLAGTSGFSSIVKSDHVVISKLPYKETHK